MTEKQKFFIETFGCQMNVQDSERMAGILELHGYEPTEDIKKAGVIILNTCSIREKAEQKFYSELGRLSILKKKNPFLRLAVAGCIAQQHGEGIRKRFPSVDFVLGPQNIDKLDLWIDGSEPVPVAIGDNTGYHLQKIPSKRAEEVRAFVSIMYGCNNFCSYCIVPYTRGREISRPGIDIYQEVKDLSDMDYKEVTLLGQNVNSYRDDAGTTIVDFPGLLYMLHQIDGIERIRFVASHPKDISAALLKAMAELPKLCEHIHLPVQSGSDRILKLMNRGYTYQKYKSMVDMLRQTIHDLSITTDIIVGFPGETEEDFEKTIDALKEIQYDGIFAFKYSERPNTAAIKLDGKVPEDTKGKRLENVLELQESITSKKNKELEGKTLEILIEGKSKTNPHRLTGRTRTNKIVNLEGDEALKGRLVNVLIIEAKQHSLCGRLID